MSVTSETSSHPTSPPLLNVISSQASGDGPLLSNLQTGLRTGPSGQVPAPVNLSARQAAEKGLLTSGTYGRAGSISSRSACLTQFLANKLKPRLSITGSTLFKMTWKELVMKSGRVVCLLRASVLRISGRGCGSWPSPMAGTPAQNGNHEAGNNDSSRRMVALVAALPTPNHNGTGAGTQGREGGLNLQTAATLTSWNTPRSTDGSNGGPNQAGGALSHDAAMTSPWSTPRANKWGFPDAHGSHESPSPSGPTQSTSPASTANPGQLNPRFSLWLMGYPAEWAFCGERAMLSFRPLRRNSSKRT